VNNPLRHVVAGEKIDPHLLPHLMSTVQCYLFASTGTVAAGTVVTAALANRAIDWWNSLGDLGRLDAAENFRDWRENQ